jgi:hypothetical protein
MADAARRLLLAHDGSPSAVRAAASLFRDARASVATVPSAPSMRPGTAVAMLPWHFAGRRPAGHRRAGRQGRATGRRDGTVDQSSDDAVYRRFLSLRGRLSEAELRYITEVDHRDHEALLAFDPDDGRGTWRPAMPRRSD